MSKRLRFLYRYFFSPNRRRRWLHTQSLLVMVFSTAFLVTLFMTAPLSMTEKAVRMRQIEATAEVARAQQATDTASPAAGDQTSPTRTPLPPEYLDNVDQSFGIALAAVLLVIIVLIGVLMFMPRDEKDLK